VVCFRPASLIDDHVPLSTPKPTVAIDSFGVGLSRSPAKELLSVSDRRTPAARDRLLYGRQTLARRPIWISQSAQTQVLDAIYGLTTSTTCSELGNRHVPFIGKTSQQNCLKDTVIIAGKDFGQISSAGVAMKSVSCSPTFQRCASYPQLVFGSLCAMWLLRTPTPSIVPDNVAPA
jgi:hypothetical protein